MTRKPLSAVWLCLAIGAVGCGSSSTDARRSPEGSYSFATSDGYDAAAGRIDIRRLGDGKLHAWVSRKFWFSGEYALDVADDHVTLRYGAPGDTWYEIYTAAREPSGRLGGVLTGHQHDDEGDAVIDRDLNGTVGPDVTAPDVYTLGFATLRDEPNLLPWNPVALDFSEPITPDEFASIPHPGLELAAKGDENWVTGAIVTLADWQAGRSGPFTLEIHDPSGNSSGPKTLELGYAPLGPARSAFDFDTDAAPLVYGAASVETTNACESGSCLALHWDAAGGCYQPSGSAFLLPKGTSSVTVRYRVYASAVIENGAAPTAVPFFFDAPGASLQATADDAAPALEPAPAGAPEAWQSDWLTQTFTLEQPVDTAAFRAEIGLCTGSSTAGLPARVLVAIESFVTK